MFFRFFTTILLFGPKKSRASASRDNNNNNKQLNNISSHFINRPIPFDWNKNGNRYRCSGACASWRPSYFFSIFFFVDNHKGLLSFPKHGGRYYYDGSQKAMSFRFMAVNVFPTGTLVYDVTRTFSEKYQWNSSTTDWRLLHKTNKHIFYHRPRASSLRGTGIHFPANSRSLLPSRRCKICAFRVFRKFVSYDT